MNSKTMKQYVIDAFTDHVFAGNPAAVCVMDAWLPEDTMMAITRENNLSETAFAVKEGDKYHLRWFTPGGEIDLCGHATLATACAIMTYIRPELTEVTFTTLSGTLGHYDAGFTLSTYTHATEGMKRSAADTIGSVISQTM